MTLTLEKLNSEQREYLKSIWSIRDYDAITKFVITNGLIQGCGTCIFSLQEVCNELYKTFGEA